ncbi:hypothetical protein BCV72DRAFT_221744 [Rhizopus microsporus var. microsporus]|nr:hypothetical protein BCV72DRAFT_221744 [Rhizopus microsporus var. microsporus]
MWSSPLKFAYYQTRLTKLLSSKVFADCVLQTPKNGQVVLVKTVEMYDRTKHVDAHRGPYGRAKYHVKSTLLPPFVGTKYEDAWPITLTGSDGDPKIVIST